MKWNATLCVVAIAWAVPARADEVKDAESTLGVAVRWVSDAKKTHKVEKDSIDRCRAAADALRKAAPATYAMTGDLEGYPKAFKTKDGMQLKRDDVGVICDELAKLLPLSDARKAVAFADFSAGIVEDGGTAQKTESVLADYETALTKCKAGVATAKAAGLTKLGDDTIADAEKSCSKLDKAMVQYRLDVAEAVKEAKAYRESLVKIYTGLGIGGEKMEFLIEYDKRALYAVGGKELVTAKEQAKASVLFSVSGSDSVTVRRYQFKGNKLVKVTEQDYVTRPGPNAFK